MKPVARVGDTHICGNPNCPGNDVIVSGGQGIVDGRQVARIGDTTACGAIIVEGSSQATDTGQPIAYQGCATQCGPYRGQIVTGSPQAKVKP